MNKKTLFTLSLFFLTLFIGKALACRVGIYHRHYINHEVGLCTTLTYEDGEKGFSLEGNWEVAGVSGTHFEFEKTYNPILCGLTEKDIQLKTFDQCCDNLGYTYTDLKSLDDEFVSKPNILRRIVSGFNNIFFEKEIIYIKRTESSEITMPLADFVHILFTFTIVPVLIVLVLIKFKKIDNPILNKFIKYYFIILIPLMMLIFLESWGVVGERPLYDPEFLCF